MPWTYQRIVEDRPHWKGYIRELMTDGTGTKIERVGMHPVDEALFSVFEFVAADISFEFEAHSAEAWTMGKDKADRISALGSTCEVTILPSKLPRLVSPEEGARLAKQIMDVLLQYGKWTGAEPPFPERVIFDELARRALHLDHQP
jgi:hypothetical protein